MKKERVKYICLCGIHIFLIVVCLIGLMLSASLVYNSNPFKPVVGVCTSTVEVVNIEDCNRILWTEYKIEGVVLKP